jgi:hypothetical protein
MRRLAMAGTRRRRRSAKRAAPPRRRRQRRRVLAVVGGGFGFLAGRNARDLNGVADDVGWALLAFRPTGRRYPHRPQ